jgi:hypothetical protein
VSRSWFTGVERTLIRDADRIKIDYMIIDLDQKAYSGFFNATSSKVVLEAYKELSTNIQECRLK